MSGVLPVGRVLGIPLWLHWSWFLTLALVTAVLAISFVIATVCWVAQAAGTAAPGPRAMLAYLAAVNWAVGIFNLVPGLPLDGGRLLRAVL